jgi:hypothetical protein
MRVVAGCLVALPRAQYTWANGNPIARPIGHLVPEHLLAHN